MVAIIIIASAINLVMLYLVKRDLLQLQNQVDLQTKQIAMLQRVIGELKRSPS